MSITTSRILQVLQGLALLRHARPGLAEPIIVPQVNINPLLLKQDLKKHRLKIRTKRPEVRIVYLGTPDFSALVLEKLIEFCQNSSDHPGGGKLNHGEPEQEVIPPVYTIQAVVTQPDKPVGRYQTLTPSPVAQVAQKYHIPTLKPEKLDEDFIKNYLALLNADSFILAAYGKLLPEKLLEIPEHGSLNIHPSLLPKYRGPSPIQAAILSGDKVTGVTIIKMDEEMDHGPIITTREIILSEQDTLDTLSKKLFSMGADLLIKIIPDFVAEKVKLVEQNHSQASYTHLIKKEDGYFDVNNPPPPEILDRIIRAYYPWPNAWTKWNNKIIKFYPKGVVHPDLIGVQMEGKKPISLTDFLHGHPDFPYKSGA